MTASTRSSRFARLGFLRPASRAAREYARRLGRWGAAIIRVRGATLRDTGVIWLSFILSPFASLVGLKKFRDPFLLGRALVVSPRGTYEVRPYTDDFGHVVDSDAEAFGDVLSSFVQFGDVVIDGGANIGVITVLASQLTGQRGKVIAVEMLPETAKQLRRNLTLNAAENVCVIDCALASEGGKTASAILPDGYFGQATLAYPHTEVPRSTRDVVTGTLDEIAASERRIALIKLDVEGAELDALKGAAETLKRTDAVIFESWDDADAIVNLLADSGFALSRINGRNWLARRKDAVKQNGAAISHNLPVT